LSTFLIIALRATYPANLILLDFIIVIILDEAYKKRSSSLCSFRQPPATSSLLAPCYQTQSTYALPLVWKIKFHTIQKQVKSELCIFYSLRC
jgi:hypothetical protein